MSILDINLEANIADFSNHDRSGRIYDPDCTKIPDEYSIPVEVVGGVYDKLPEVGDPNKIYIVNDKLYMYTVYGDWCDLSPISMEAEERIKESMDGGEYFSEYHEKRMRDLKDDIKLRLKELARYHCNGE